MSRPMSGVGVVGRVVVIAGVGAYNLIAANEWAGSLPETVEWTDGES